MAVTYKKLFKLLIDRDMKKQDLAEEAKISPATISKMAAGENVTMEVIFEYEEEEEKKEKDEEKEKNKDNKGAKEPIGDCQMLIELFEYEKGKYLLEFRRTGGKYADYYHHFLKIKEIITKKN